MGVTMEMGKKENLYPLILTEDKRAPLLLLQGATSFWALLHYFSCSLFYP
jgi:hypothetical protein